MTRIDTIVIGAGQAGLATSWCLGDLGIDHVVLERGRIGERWRSERWPSLRLQTPRWQARLPGWSYAGPDPDGFMSMPEIVGYLEGYARRGAAPVREGVTVRAAAFTGGRWRIDTDAGAWSARCLIVATGHADVPFVPALAGGLAGELHQVVPSGYRGAAGLPVGGVVVVGASATGVQLADELRAAGREVTLAVGGHTRLPRVHRGRDIMAWLDAMGTLDQPASAVRELAAARRQPSLQLIGEPGRTLDLASLQRAGVRLTGRLCGADGHQLAFADDLAATTGAAAARLDALLERIDRYAATARLAPAGAPATPAPVAAAGAPRTLDLRAEGITSVLWATGYQRRYSWLRAPAALAGGDLRHHGGVTPLPGLYAVGLRFQLRRNSSFLDGVGGDARAISGHVASYLGHRRAAA
jgi:putative flavoprotein involved in K+ transport